MVHVQTIRYYTLSKIQTRLNPKLCVSQKSRKAEIRTCLNPNWLGFRFQTFIVFFAFGIQQFGTSTVPSTKQTKLFEIRTCSDFRHSLYIFDWSSFFSEMFNFWLLVASPTSWGSLHQKLLTKQPNRSRPSSIFSSSSWVGSGTPRTQHLKGNTMRKFQRYRKDIHS